MQQTMDDQKHGWVKIMVIYRKPCCNMDRCVQMIGNCGAYTHCELYCPEMLHNGKLGWSFTNFSFCEMEVTQESVHDYRKYPFLFDAHEILIRREQHDKLLQWNLDLVDYKCSYNYSDLMLHLLPKSVARVLRPDNKDILLSPQKLYCAQAVILALRHALGPIHRISQLLIDINIHLCKPSSINEHLSRILGPPTEMKHFAVV